MKLEAKSPPRVLQIRNSVAHRSIGFLLLLLAFFLAGPIHTARASQYSDSIAAVKALAKQPNISAADYASGVAAIVTADRDDAYAIIAEAISDEPNPGFACGVIKAGILAVTPQGATPDPKVIASIVAAVVTNIQANNPGLVQQIISCALAENPDAGLAIQNALATLFNGAYGLNRPPWTFGNGSGVPGGGGGPGGTPPIKPLPTPHFPVTHFRPE